jgi:hypothetical protein
MTLSLRHTRGFQARAYIDINGNNDPTGFYGTKASDIMAETFPDGYNMARIGRGITDFTPASSETTDTESDMLDAGFQKSNISAKSITYALTGNRYIGDPAQDFIFEKFSKLGRELETTAVIIDPDGTIRISEITITSPVAYSGAVNANSPISATLTVDGKPYVIHTDGSVECKVDTLNVAPNPVAVAVGATVQVTATPTPEYATNVAVDYSIKDTSVATVDENGKVTGVAEGTTILQVYLKSDEAVAQLVPVTVSKS